MERKDYLQNARASGGVVTLTPNIFPSKRLNINSQLQVVSVQIQLKSLITVCFIYLPPNEIIRPTDLNDLIQQLPVPFIILGDFNGHNTLWGSVDTTARGRQVEKLLDDHFLCLLNNCSFTHFHPATKTFHTIDLAICSPSLAPYWDFSVSDDLFNSDHFPIILTYSRNDFNFPKRPIRFIFDNADWRLFNSHCDFTEDMGRQPDVNKVVDSVTKCLLKAADIAFQSLQEIFQANHIAFKRAKSFFRKIRRQSKNGSFQKYVGSIQGHLSSKRMWEKVRKILGDNKFYHGISFLQTNGQLVSHTKGIANTLGSAFANVSSGDSYSQTFIHYKKQQEKKRRIDFNTLTSLAYNVDFSLHELRRAIRSSHPTTPGPDGIHYDMLKNLSIKSLGLLLILFNRIWNEHVFPMAWNRAIVIPILKPGKNPEDPSSYRPIALTSCLCKTLERMINARLIHVLEEKKLLTEFQSGFRYGRSTMDNILNLETAIRDAFITKKHLVSIFFDMEKAYDRAWRHGILNDLHNVGFRGNLPIFIQNFLLKRTFNVRINDILSDNFIQNEGSTSSVIYGSAAKSVVQQLDTVHHQGLRLAAGAFRTSPVQSLYVITGEPCLKLRCERFSLKYYFKIKQNPSHPSYERVMKPIFGQFYEKKVSFIPSFGHRMRPLLENFNLKNIDILPKHDEPPPWRSRNVLTVDDFHKLPKSTTAPSVYIQEFYYHRQKFERYGTVFTDGSKFGDHVGSAVVFNHIVISRTLNKHSSVFTSEIFAIYTALRAIRLVSQKKWIIYTDSQSFIEAILNASRQSHPLVLSTVKLYFKLQDRNFDILFCWIPGHVGISGNDETDAAAKAASSNVETFVTFQDIDQVLKQTILIKWQHIWDLELNNKLHSIQPSIAGFQPNNLNRRMSVKLARLRLGHTYFTHKHLLYADPAPSCSSCSTIISVRHILCECPKYRVLRRKYFGKAYPDLRDILGEHYNANVFSFVHDINFIHSI
ncbi:putative RNA-directed DNA polymerase from transposon X-element [Araneus ventricosus]|uniref:Putative RNA-directed DNA polymerase from transposon X-element n=1 Tax=Araneus ventricosus TaxID=182803 RepID=A0A4Y2UYX6_ARAVE|nr:putative RNA-directed DNA polymerase from transposon X-element [Araneus ventricosus]